METAKSWSFLSYPTLLNNGIRARRKGPELTEYLDVGQARRCPALPRRRRRHEKDGGRRRRQEEAEEGGVRSNMCSMDAGNGHSY